MQSRLTGGLVRRKGRPGRVILRKHVLALICFVSTEADGSQGDAGELRGLDLKVELSSAEVLQRLFLSVLCLHHYVHDAHDVREMDFDTWKRMHDADPISDVALFKIWHAVCSQPTPALSVLLGLGWEHGQPGREEGHRQGHGDGERLNARTWMEGKQGWLSITSTPPHEIGDPSGRYPVWASISLGLLFFSLSPNSAAPEAFLSLQGVFASWDGSHIVLERWQGSDAKHVSPTAPNAYISVALLRPDGSWKECNFTKVELGTVDDTPQSWLQSLDSFASDKSWV